MINRMVLSRGLILLRSTRYQSATYVKQRRMSSAATDDVMFEDVGNKGIITLTRPRSLNALTHGMVCAMYPKLREWEHTKSLVIIKGSGGKAFCAGGDLLSIVNSGKTGGSLARDFFRDEYRLNCLIGTYDIPYISFIDGIVMGGGVGISVHGSYRVATEKTLFAMPETAVGLFPDVGGAYFLPRLGGQLGMFLALTGQRLKGRDVQRAGVATHVCSSERLGELQDQLCTNDSTYSEDVASILKKFNDDSSFGKDKDFILKPYLSQINKCFAGDSIEHIISNLREDGSEWALKQIDVLNKMSPTSLTISHEQLRRGANLTLPECLSMEFRLTQKCVKDHDLYEGVRSVLVDKDQNPQWKPSQINEVDRIKTIDRYFASLSPEEELNF